MLKKILMKIICCIFMLSIISSLIHCYFITESSLTDTKRDNIIYNITFLNLISINKKNIDIVNDECAFKNIGTYTERLQPMIANEIVDINLKLSKVFIGVREKYIIIRNLLNSSSLTLDYQGCIKLFNNPPAYILGELYVNFGNITKIYKCYI